MLAAQPRVPGESDRDRDRVVRMAPVSPMDPITSALRKLHNNLGHPSKNTLLRVLKNSGASADALKKTSKFSCPASKSSSSHTRECKQVREFEALI